MFTDIKPVARPIVKLVDNLEPYWISGFITAVPEGEGVPFGGGNGMFLEEATQASLHLFFYIHKKKV